MIDWAMLIGGGALLYLGAEWFVGGASSLALALRVPRLLVGLTVVAYGTSAPEVIVGVEAALSGHGEVALGNVLGSNIANLGLILGLAALVRPARVDGTLRRRELPVLLVSTAAVPVLLLDGRVTRWEAAGLLAAALSYTALMVGSARSASAVALAASEARVAGEAVSAAGAPRPSGAWRAATIASVGLMVLLAGGNLFVRAAVSLAQLLGMSERLVGVTIVAVGTSLPELVTSLIAARRGHADLAVGNVVGSNIFNVLLCLGAAAIAGPVGAPLGVLAVDLAGFLVLTALGAVFIRTERTITRLEGALALAAYVAFVVLTVAKG